MKLALVAIALVIALAGCVVLRPPRPDERPRWRLTSSTAWGHDCAPCDGAAGASVPMAEQSGGCAGVLGRAFVRKSGKDGVGVTVELRSRGDCTVVIARAELVLASGARVPAGIRQVPPMRGRSLLYTWLGFPFDNNRAWNRGDVDGVFELDLVLDGVPAPTWRITAHHAMTEPGAT